MLFAQRVLTGILLLSVTAIARAEYIADYEAGEVLWVTESGQYQVEGFLAGGAASEITGHFDADTHILTLSQTVLGSDIWAPEESIYFTFSALLSDFYGEFIGGTYSLIAGVNGLPAIGLDPGELVLQGTVIEFESQFVRCEDVTWDMGRDCDTLAELTGHDVEDQLYLQDVFWMPALLSVDYAADGLGLESDFLTFMPYINIGSQASAATTPPWTESFDILGAELGFALLYTTKVPEPETLGLLVIGLAGMALTRRTRRTRRTRKLV